MKNLTEKELDDIFDKFDPGRRYIVAKLKSKEIVPIEVSKLKPHPQNELIYGENEDVSDLIEKIEAFNGKIIEPLKIKEDFTIISGYRRWKAAQSEELKLATVPCEYVSFDSDEEELAAIVLYNDGRAKTLEQRTREGMALEKTFMVDAYLRKIKALKWNQTDMDTEAISEDTDDNEKGLTRDKVAAAVKISSGRTYDRAKSVIARVDELKAEGKVEDAKLLIDIMNQAPATAKRLLNVFDTLSNEDKEKIRTGEANASDFIPDNEESKKETDTTSVTAVMKDCKSIGSAIASMKKKKPIFKTDNQKEKYRKELETQLANLQDILKSLD